ncbi:unnamed protein product [Boreogadus saida]
MALSHPHNNLGIGFNKYTSLKAVHLRSTTNPARHTAPVVRITSASNYRRSPVAPRFSPRRTPCRPPNQATPLYPTPFLLPQYGLIQGYGIPPFPMTAQTPPRSSVVRSSPPTSARQASFRSLPSATTLVFT